jgi:hypothetical protein
MEWRRRMGRASFGRAARVACVIMSCGAMLGAAWAVAGRVPDLRGPIRITDASLFADGGSAWVAVADVTGKQIAFGVQGSLRRTPAEFPIYLQRWYPVMPVPVPVDRDSAAGRALLKLVERAGRDGGTQAVQALAPIRAALLKSPQ